VAADPLPLPEGVLEREFEGSTEAEPLAEPCGLAETEGDLEPDGVPEREPEREPEPEAEREPSAVDVGVCEKPDVVSSAPLFCASPKSSTKIISRFLDSALDKPVLLKQNKRKNQNTQRMMAAATRTITAITMPAMAPPGRAEVVVPLPLLELPAGGLLGEGEAFRQAWVGLPEQVAVGNQILLAPAAAQLAASFFARQKPIGTPDAMTQHAPVDVDCNVVGQSNPGRSYTATAPKAVPMFSQTVSVNEPVP